MGNYTPLEQHYNSFVKKLLKPKKVKKEPDYIFPSIYIVTENIRKNYSPIGKIRVVLDRIAMSENLIGAESVTLLVSVVNSPKTPE
jgi:hypothetical protein